MTIVSGFLINFFSSHNCSDVTKEYQKEMKKLAGKLMWIMLESLGITKEDITWAGPNGEFEDSGGVLQLNSYPICPDPGRAIPVCAPSGCGKS